MLSPFMSEGWADWYRGRSKPLLSDDAGVARFNTLLRHRGFDGKLHPLSTQMNYYPLIQPNLKVWREGESHIQSGNIKDRQPLLQMSISSPGDGLLTGSEKLKIELSGSLMTSHYGVGAGARSAAMHVFLDGEKRKLNGSQFSLPFEENISIQGNLGRPELTNGLHELRVTVIAIDVPAALTGSADGRATNVSVSASTVFYLWKGESRVQDQHEAVMEENIPQLLSGKTQEIQPLLETGAERARVAWFTSPTTLENSSRKVAKSSNLGLAARWGPEHRVLLGVDDESFDVSEMAQAALPAGVKEGLVEFNVAMHGLTSGTHTLQMKLLSVNRLGDGTEQVGTLLGSDIMQVECCDSEL